MSRIVAVAGMFALVIAGLAPGSWAQGLVTMQKLSAPLANELVGDTVAICAQRGYTVTAVVVDLDGVRQALLRGNGAPIHTLDNAAERHVCGRRRDDPGGRRADRRDRGEWRAGWPAR